MKKEHGSVIGWLRNPNQLAHLFENGFTISDILIATKTANGVMAFEMAGVGQLYRQYVHRHETKVPAYPAIHPALAAHAADVREAAQTAAEGG